MGHHRERDRLARPPGGLANGMVRVAVPRWGPGEWRPLRGERPALPGRADRHVRHLPAGEDPTRPILVVTLRAAVLHVLGSAPGLRRVRELGRVLWRAQRGRGAAERVARRLTRDR